MPRRSRRFRSRRRGISRIPRRHRGFTPVKAIKAFVAFGPVTAKALQAAGANGGLMSRTGWERGVLPAVSTSYTGYNTNDGKFYGSDMVVGYVPLIGAWVLGKVLARLRVI